MYQFHPIGKRYISAATAFIVANPRSAIPTTLKTHTSAIAPLARIRRAISATSAATADTMSPRPTAAATSAGMRGSICPGAYNANGAYRNTCTQSNGTSASSRDLMSSRGATCHRAMSEKATRLNVDWMLSARKGLMSPPPRLRDGSGRGQPIESLLSVDEPPGGKDRRPLDGFLPRVRETSRHHEGELAHTGGAVPRNDVGIAPLHHAGAELVPKLDGVDQEAQRSRPLGLPREEAQRRHEPAIAHARGGRQPAQL